MSLFVSKQRLLSLFVTAGAVILLPLYSLAQGHGSSTHQSHNTERTKQNDHQHSMRQPMPSHERFQPKPSVIHQRGYEPLHHMERSPSAPYPSTGGNVHYKNRPWHYSFMIDLFRVVRPLVIISYPDRYFPEQFSNEYSYAANRVEALTYNYLLPLLDREQEHTHPRFSYEVEARGLDRVISTNLPVIGENGLNERNTLFMVVSPTRTGSVVRAYGDVDPYTGQREAVEGCLNNLEAVRIMMRKIANRYEDLALRPDQNSYMRRILIEGGYSNKIN